MGEEEVYKNVERFIYTELRKDFPKTREEVKTSLVRIMRELQEKGMIDVS